MAGRREEGYHRSGWSRDGSVDHKPFFLEHHVQVVHGPIDFALLLRSSTNELPRGEEKYHGLGVWHPVDQTGELLRLVHRFCQLSSRFFYVNPPPKVRRCHHVLY